MWQYFVWIEDSEEDESDEVVEHLFQATDDDRDVPKRGKSRGRSAKKKNSKKGSKENKKKKKQRRSSSTASSTSTSCQSTSATESSSSSEACNMYMYNAWGGSDPSH